MEASFRGWLRGRSCSHDATVSRAPSVDCGRHRATCRRQPPRGGARQLRGSPPPPARAWRSRRASVATRPAKQATRSASRSRRAACLPRPRRWRRGDPSCPHRPHRSITVHGIPFLSIGNDRMLRQAPRADLRTTAHLKGWIACATTRRPDHGRHSALDQRAAETARRIGSATALRAGRSTARAWSALRGSPRRTRTRPAVA